MPTITLTTPPDALAGADVPALLETLGDVLRAAERVPDTDFFKAQTWAWHQEAVHHSGGGAPRYLVRATVPQGALNAKRTAELVTGCTDAVAAAAGVVDADRGSIWVLVSEIDEGSWAVGGQVILFEELRAQLRARKEEAAASA